ncbi:MAG: hypothetical protein R3B93_08425 [Bacteroidia bacterium]
MIWAMRKFKAIDAFAKLTAKAKALKKGVNEQLGDLLNANLISAFYYGYQQSQPRMVDIA